MRIALLNGLTACLLSAHAYGGMIWSQPYDLSTAGYDAVGPKVAFDFENKAIMVWSRYNGSNYVVQAMSRRVDGTWTQRSDLSDPNFDSHFVNLQNDGGSNTLAIWSAVQPTQNEIQSILDKYGIGWGPTRIVATSAPGNARLLFPQIAFDTEGNAVAVWLLKVGDYTIIQSSTKLAGELWTNPLEVTPASGPFEIKPQIAMDPTGKAIAVWPNEDTLTIQCAYKPLLDEWMWTEPKNISLPGTAVGQPQIAIDHYGNATAVWIRNDGINFIVQAATKPKRGKWAAPVNLSAAGYDALTPQLAIDSSGTVTAIWSRSNGGTTVIEVSYLPLKGTWSTPIVLSNPAQDANEPQIKIASNGNAVAAWKISNGQNFIIQACYKPFGSDWTTPANLSLPGQDAVSPQIAVGNVGNAAIVWQRSNGANNIVQASFGVTNTAKTNQ